MASDARLVLPLPPVSSVSLLPEDGEDAASATAAPCSFDSGSPHPAFLLLRFPAMGAARRQIRPREARGLRGQHGSGRVL